MITPAVDLRKSKTSVTTIARYTHIAQVTSRPFFFAQQDKIFFRVPIFSSRKIYYSARIFSTSNNSEIGYSRVFSHVCSEGQISIINGSIFMHNFKNPQAI